MWTESVTPPQPRLPSSRSCPAGVRLGPDRKARAGSSGSSRKPGASESGSRSWASELPGSRARNPDFSGPESRKSGSGFRERNPGPPARADRKPRLRGGAPSRKPGAKARPRRSGFRHRTPAPVTLAPPVTSTAGPSYANFGAAAHELGIGRLRSLRASEPPAPRPRVVQWVSGVLVDPPKILEDGRAPVADEDRREFNKCRPAQAPVGPAGRTEASRPA